MQPGWAESTRLRLCQDCDCVADFQIYFSANFSENFARKWSVYSLGQLSARPMDCFVANFVDWGIQRFLKEGRLAVPSVDRIPDPFADVSEMSSAPVAHFGSY